MEIEDKKSTMDEYKDPNTIGLAEKVEIISTDDSKIKSVGELLSSDSSRNILKLLFDQVLTANQISQKTGISLPLVIYHLKKMQEMGVVKITNVGKNVKAQDMKFYTSSKFAIVILPSNLTEKAKTSKSLANSFKTIYRFAAIGVAAVATWFVSQFTQNIQTNQPVSIPAPAASPAINAPLTSTSTTTSSVQSAANSAAPPATTAPAASVPTMGQAAPVPFGAEHQTAPLMTSAAQAPQSFGIAVDILWSVVLTLSVIVAGLIIERVLRAYRR